MTFGSVQIKHIYGAQNYKPASIGFKICMEYETLYPLTLNLETKKSLKGQRNVCMQANTQY